MYLPLIITLKLAFVHFIVKYLSITMRDPAYFALIKHSDRKYHQLDRMSWSLLLPEAYNYYPLPAANTSALIYNGVAGFWFKYIYELLGVL